MKEGGRGPGGQRGQGLLGVIAGVMVVPLFYLAGAGAGSAVVPYLVACLLVFFIERFFSEGELSGAISSAGARLVGIVYITLPLSHLVLLGGTEPGRWWILFLLIVIWASDTSAFFVGRTLGRHKLCPAISPNKTVEGGVGGLLGAAGAAFIFNRYFSLGAGDIEVLILGVFLGTLGILGDLVESAMKRGAGVKDSGTVIPGHGGMLDRIDSMLFAVPALYYYLVWRAGGLL